MANVIKHKRGSGSDPAANNLVLGELAIRTDVGKLFTKMDSGAIAEIAGGGSDIAINTLSSSSATGGGSATFNGSAYRFTLSAPPSVSAQQLLVSINGVIQKPVAGTGQPSEGFSVSGNDIILGDAPATGADFFILTFKSLGVSEPADNSVTSAKIVDGAIVNADINASAAIAGSKITPTFTSAISQSDSGGASNAFATNIQINTIFPSLSLNDTDSENDFQLQNQNGLFAIRDADAGGGTNRLTISSAGITTIAGNLDVGAGIDVTGAITGTGDMTIDTNTLHVDSSNNRVGIGTTSPAVKFVVSNGGAEGLEVSHSSGNVELNAYNRSGSARSPVGIVGQTFTVTTGNPSLNTGLFQNSSGNVSIGSTSNVAPLNVKAETDGNLHIRTIGSIASAPAGSGIGLDVLNDGGSAVKDLALRGSTTIFRNASAETMRIDSSGRLLVGTTTLGEGSADNLTIADSGHCGITIRSGSSSGGNLFFTDATSDQFQGFVQYNHSTNHLGFGTQKIERMRIDSSGRVLIGASTEGNESADELTIGSSGNTGITLRSGTSANTSLFFSDATSGTAEYAGSVQYRHASDVMTFGTASTERMRLNSGGDLLLGLTSTPSGNGTNLWVSDGTVARLGLEKTGTGAVKTSIGAGSDRAFNIYNETADHEIIKGETNGDVKITTGNLVIGTAGKGIDFSATSGTGTSELLDDYEEGTWNPVFTDDGTSGNSASSYGDRVGWYVKIGNFVNVWCRVGAINFSGFNTSHAAFIKGLPYVIKAGTDRLNTGTLMLSNVNIDGGTVSVGILSNTGGGASNSFFRMFQTIDNAVWVSIKVSQFTSGSNEIMCNFSYQTT